MIINEKITMILSVVLLGVGALFNEPWLGISSIYIHIAMLWWFK